MSSPADTARIIQASLDAGAELIHLDRETARDVADWLWAASWAELLGWDCKRRKRQKGDHHEKERLGKNR